MSNQLITARKKLNAVSTMLKKGKYMAAVQSIHDGLILFLKNPVMKGERDEFEEILHRVTQGLAQDKGLRQVYPLVITYTPGEERKLLDEMRTLLKELQQALSESAQGDMQAMIAQRQEKLEQGQSHLDNQEWEQAKAVFDAVTSQFSEDTDLKADIADRYLNAGRHEEAFHMLDDALKGDPNAIHLYNRIGMVLRKMQQFETAEKYYKKALSLSSTDEYLLYNVGRLYYDWKKWDKMAEAAKAALAINPEFGEAAKMLKFAQKKLA